MTLPYPLTVDGHVFHVAVDDDQPGTVHIAWLSGPNPGYGFSLRRSSGIPSSEAQAAAEIRLFLAAIDPATGYL